MVLFVRFLLLWLFAAGAQAQPVLDLPADADSISAKGFLALWAGENPNPGIAEVSAPENGDRFRPLAEEFNLGYGTRDVWLRLEVRPREAGPQTWWLEVAPAFLDHVRLYVPRPEGGMDVDTAGDREPWAGRPVFHRNPVFVLHLRPDRAQYLYLHIHTISPMAADVTLWRPTALYREAAKSAYLYGGYFAVVLFVVIVNLLYYFGLRQRLFLVYPSYVAIGALMVAVTDGYMHLFLQPRYPLYLEQLIGAVQTVLPLQVYLLVRDLTGLDRAMPRMDRVCRWLVGTLFAFGALALLFDAVAWSIPLMWLAIAVEVLGLLTILALILAWRGSSGARLFLLAFGALDVASVIRILYINGLVDTSFWVNNGLLIGFYVHTLFMQVAVLARAKEIQQGYLRDKEDALALARRTGEMLEQRVAERTHELEAANRCLSEEVAARTHLSRDLERARLRTEKALLSERDMSLAQSNFLRLVAHEFRTPLATIQSAIDILELGPEPLSEVRQRNLERMKSAVARLTRMAETALREERFEGVLWRANAEWIDIEPFLKEVAAKAEGGPEVVVESCSCRLQADRELIEILLASLLDNARKYSPAESIITLNAGLAPNGEVVIGVTDQGPGVAEEERDMIFDRYFRGETAVDSPGLGLGLYLAQRIALLHGGRIEMENRPQGGCSFTLHLSQAGASPVLERTHQP